MVNADHSNSGDRTSLPFAARRRELAGRAAAAGVDAVVLSPGADLAYFAGMSIGSHERLTALVVPAAGEEFLLVPKLERPGWGGPAADLPVRTWADGDDPYAVLASVLAGASAVAVDERMPVGHALRTAAAIGVPPRLAGDLCGALRTRKTPDEVDELAAIGAAIDRVHRDMGRWLRAGRTEAEVAADIGREMLADGHSRADFVIVGSGPNGASPHHEASDRVIRPGDLVVVDVGGPGHAGYYSDCTRTYQVAGTPADPEMARVYEVVRVAQQAGIDAVRPGVPAASVDAAARAVIAEAGYGEHFITRTGHGIGLEVHEDPYLVAGNETPLEPGMAFSIEPGIYLPGRFGVRIEDIVVVGPDGALLMNTSSKQLTVVG